GLEGGIIFISAVLIVAKVVMASVNGASPERAELGVGLMVMCGALLANGALGVYLWRCGRGHHAVTLEAGGGDLISDAVNGAVVIGAVAVLRWTGWAWVDSAGAMLVAAYMAWLGTKLIRRSAAGLMDAQDVADDALVRGILESHMGPNGKEPRV